MEKKIKLIESIEELSKSKATPYSNFISHKLNALKDVGGLYAFWWAGSSEELETLNTKLEIKGPLKKKGNGEHIIHSINLFDIAHDADNICLYIGKSSTLHQRIANHLSLKVEANEWYTTHKKINGKEYTPNKKSNVIVKRHSTFRGGLEHLYKNNDVSTQDKLNKIAISTLKLSDDKSWKDRFYLENLAIGIFQPWFNLDSER